jgi:TolA-binding protein
MTFHPHLPGAYYWLGNKNYGSENISRFGGEQL